MAITALALRPGQTFEKAPSEAPSKTHSKLHFRLWGEDGLTLGDLIDVVNPLQHLPVISSLYRAWTGDSLAPLPRLLGDTLFGGAIGAAVSAANIVLEQVTGKDAGAQVLALLHIPTHSEAQTTTIAKTVPLSTPFSSLSPALASAKSAQSTKRSEAHAQAARQFQLATALNAYTHSRRFLATEQTGKHVSVGF